MKQLFLYLEEEEAQDRNDREKGNKNDEPVITPTYFLKSTLGSRDSRVISALRRHSSEFGEARSQNSQLRAPRRREHH